MEPPSGATIAQRCEDLCVMRRHVEDVANCETRTLTHLLFPPLSPADLSWDLPAKFRWLVVMVTAESEGYLHCFCFHLQNHVIIHTVQVPLFICVLQSAWLSAYFSVFLSVSVRVCLPSVFVFSLCRSQHVTDLFTISALSGAQLEHYMYLHLLCSAPILH